MSLFNVNKGVPILTYHSIDNSDSVISVSPAKFRHHMAYLKKVGYETLSLHDVLDHIQRGEIFPEKRIVITFDDGLKNNYTRALPVLRENGYTAIVFLTTNRIGGNNDWSDQHSSIPALPMMSWENINAMTEYGIEFGAHTRSHPQLTRIDIAEAREEMYRSKVEIEDKLKRPVDFFSYPFGDFNAEIKEIATSMFKGVISTIPGKVSLKSDIYALPRINAAGKIFNYLPFNLLCLGTFDSYLLIKSAMNKVSALRKK